MPSKTLRRKAKLVVRGEKRQKNTIKSKKMRNYLGGGTHNSYKYDDNFNRAHAEIYSSPDDAIYWLEQARGEHPEDEEIDELIEQLQTSQRLLNSVQRRLDELVR